MTRVIKNPSGFHSRGKSAEEKARHFGEHVHEYGWAGKWSQDEDTGILHLFARRDENETIDVWWLPTGAAHPDMLPIYTLAGEKIKCRNVSAIAHLAMKTPDENRLRKAVQKQTRRRTVKPEVELNIKEQTDDEIAEQLLGKTITWVNTISGKVDIAMIGDNPRQLRVIRNGHDYIDFVQRPRGKDERFGDGYRSVYLDSIVKVK